MEFVSLGSPGPAPMLRGSAGPIHQAGLASHNRSRWRKSVARRALWVIHRLVDKSVDKFLRFPLTHLTAMYVYRVGRSSPSQDRNKEIFGMELILLHPVCIMYLATHY